MNKTNHFNNSYQTSSKLSTNSWITDPRVPDPDNIPKPLGFLLLVRPYPVAQNKEKSRLIMPEDEIDYLNYVTNIGRVVAIGPCAWNRSEHHNKAGEQEDWVKVGDFISFPKNVGAKRKYKGVSFMLMTDDEINEVLPDPQVFDTDGYYKLDIPQEDLEKYNTIYKKESK